MFGGGGDLRLTYFDGCLVFLLSFFTVPNKMSDHCFIMENTSGNTVFSHLVSSCSQANQPHVLH